MLTPKEYVDKAGTKCPNCHSGRITVQDRNYNGYNLYQQFCWCKNCKASWTEEYLLSGYTDLELPEEEQGIRVIK